MRRMAVVNAAVLLIGSATAPAADRPARGEAVRALLARSRLLEDVRFRVPVGAYRHYLREVLGIAPAMPPPVACVATDGRYHLTLDEAAAGSLAATVTYHVLDPRPGRDLPVLTAARTWTKITVNGKAASPAVRGRWLCLRPREPGPYVVAARTTWPGEADEGGKLAFDVPRTARTILRFDSPSRWQVTAGGSAGRVSGQAKEGTHGELSLTPRTRVEATFARPVELPPRPPRYELRGATAWNLDVGRQQLAVSARVGIFGGRTDRLVLRLPPAARQVSIVGPDVREARISVGGATVFLRGAITGQTRLEVSYELPLGAGNIQRLQRLDLQGGHFSAGTVVVTNTAGGTETLPHAVTGLREIHPEDLPAEARRILAGKPVLAYEITARSFAAAVDVVRLGEFALRESIADLAHYQLLLRPDGEVLCKVDYEIRNRTRQFLRLTLPGGAQVLAARVNDKPRPLTPLAGRPGVHLLPLVRSQASVRGLVSFPVQVVVLLRGDNVRRRGEIAVPLPRIDLPIAYGWCELYAPRGMDVGQWSGPMRPVVRYSSETAVASLSYGRGEMAEGYAMADRPTIEARPERGDDGPSHTKASGRKWRLPGIGDLLPFAMQVAAPPPTTQPRAQPDRPTGITTTVTPVDGGALVLGGQVMLARNYYRAGRDYYEKGDYDKAGDSFTNAIRLAPKNPEAANAARLLANIKMVRGNLATKSRQEKALGRQVKKEISSLNLKLEQQQRKLIEQAGEAAREGRQAEAHASYQAAASLGEKLIARGAEQREQGVRLREATKELGKFRKQQEARAARLRHRYAAYKTAGKYDEALKIGKALQRLDGGEGKKDRLRGELEDLAVKTVRRHVRQGAPQTPGKTSSRLRRPETTVGSASGTVRVRSGDRTGRPAVTKTYDVRDLILLPARPGVAAKAHDQTRSAKNLLGSLRGSLEGKSVNGDAGIRFANGRLVIRATEGGQKLAGELLGKLRGIRGPQVEVSSNIAQQRAAGLVQTDTDLNGDGAVDAPKTGLTDDDGKAATRKRSEKLVSLPAFQDFLKRNYDWQVTPRQADGSWGYDAGTRDTLTVLDSSGGMTAGGRGAGGVAVLSKIPVAGRLFASRERAARALSSKALTNLGQKVAVNSMNLDLSPAVANRLGVRFEQGRNDINYAVVDEAQLRTLRELAARRSGRGRSVAANPRLQETIVGTDAMLASGQAANVTFAGESGNTIDLYSNPIALPHEKYILIDNRGFLTAVRAGEMQHWTRQAKPVEFAEIPQDLDVPRVGRLVKFEKTLIKPADELTIRARYTWTGKE